MKTKMMSSFISMNIAGIFFLCCISCKETVSESLDILLHNSTDSLIHVTLYPKAEYRSGYLYRKAEGSGGYNETVFSLPPNNKGYYDWEGVLYASLNLDMKPYTLASNVFDSIHISLAAKKDVILKFTPEKVAGYSENIFSENSMWDYKVERTNSPDMSSRNFQIHNCYIFSILEDKITIK